MSSEEMETEQQSEAQAVMETVTAPTDSLPAIDGTHTKNEPNLDRILDLPLVLSAQLGSVKMLIKDLLQLGPGSVVELDKLAGEPLEVLVNDKLVARGEVVMVNEKFGIRLTDVVSPTERVNQLS